MKHYLYVQDNTCYAEQGEELTQVSENWSELPDSGKKGLFLEAAANLADVSKMQQLNKFKIMTFDEVGTLDKSSYVVKAIPKEYIVLPHKLMLTGTYEGIDKALLTSAFTGQGNCKILVTTDLKKYKTYKAGQWQDIDHTDLVTVGTDGINAADLGNIPRSAWDGLLKDKTGIAFAYLPVIEATTDKCEIDKLALTVDMKGTWEQLEM